MFVLVYKENVAEMFAGGTWQTPWGDYLTFHTTETDKAKTYKTRRGAQTALGMVTKSVGCECYKIIEL